MKRVCAEEASLPPDMAARVVPAGMVSYKYSTPKGLSTKVLSSYVQIYVLYYLSIYLSIYMYIYTYI